MAITIKPANLYTPKTSYKFMKSMASGGLARFIMLEALVESGRTYQAYQRGGFDEGRERITEEFTGAVFWLGGVKAFNAINDKIGKYVLNMRTANFDLGEDSARNPVANFIHSESNIKTGAKFTQNQIAKFKTAKLVASILMANAMIGFVVPKINQSITRYYHRNDIKPATKNNDNNYSIQAPTMKDFLNNSTRNKDITFGAGASKLMSVAFNLENNTTWQLLSTDVGTASGRAISARNKDERREILFRDLSSIIFYMFNMPAMNKLLNMIENSDHRSTRVDSINADYTSDLLKQIIRENGGSISADKLSEQMLGENKSFKLPEAIKAEFKNGYMTLEEFKNKIPQMPFIKAEEVSKYTKMAEDMAKLQPAVEGTERITLNQAERMFQGGYLNNPEFMKNIYELEFGKDKPTITNFFRKIFGKEKLPETVNYLNPYKFISNSSVEGVDSDLKYFVEKIINKARKTGENITEKTITRAVKKNFRLNVLNWGTGFAISGLFLSTLIPKMQYWMTKKLTGSNQFPGTEEYRKQ